MEIKILFRVIIGILCLILGAIGLAVPVLPTTPFVLAAAGCFSYTPKLQAYLTKLPFFRNYIENWQYQTGLSRRTICGSLIFLWGMLLLSMYLIQTLWACILLLCVGIAVTIHILWVGRKKKS